MKSLFLSIAFFILASPLARANDYGDKNCNIFVIEAENTITGGHGNFLSAQVAVAKNLINRDFKNYQVRILGSEAVNPTSVQDRGTYLVFTFDKYAPGIEYHGNSASVLAFISNGMDRLFDNNDNVYLVQRYNWRYTNPRCQI